jgi:carboxypeptidase T
MALYSVTIFTDSPAGAARLRTMDLDLHERAARKLPDSGEIAVPGILDDDQIQRVRAAGYRVQIEQDLEQVAAARSADVDPSTNRLAPGARAGAEGAATRAEDASAAVRTLEGLMDLAEPSGNRADPAAGARDDPAARAVLGGYLTPDEVDTALQALAVAHSDVASVIPLPERTWEGRTVHVLRIRAGAERERVGVLVTGSMHAREWGGSDICIAFATNLLKSYAAQQPLKYGGKAFTAAQVKAILERLDLFVLANVNPDGKAFSQTNDPGNGAIQGFWWRKNRNPNPGLSARGVDVNRNFDFLWSSGIGTSPSPSSFTFKGKGAFSEPETRNIRWLLDEHPQIAYYVDVHSHGELILYPWGDDENQSTDPDQNFLNPAFDGVRGKVDEEEGAAVYREFMPPTDQAALEQLAQAMDGAINAVRGKDYTVQQAVGLYPTSATSDDYIFSRHLVNPALGKVYGFTIEFGREFVPPYTEMRKIMADVAAALTELCRRVADA